MKGLHAWYSATTVSGSDDRGNLKSSGENTYLWKDLSHSDRDAIIRGSPEIKDRQEDFSQFPSSKTRRAYIQGDQKTSIEFSPHY